MPIPFLCGDEMGLTLLDFVELLARSNHIQAAHCIANRIVDTTQCTAAMEAIAIGQLEGGDQTGAFHTAKLIPEEINRSHVLMCIAFEQARSGNVQGAIETSDHIKSPLRKDAVLLGITLIRARVHDIPGALVTVRHMGSEFARARAYSEIDHP
jgi:hypothetical protein